jgi:hypothetical protein
MVGPWPRRRLPHRQARARLRLYCHPTVCASVALSLDCQNRADLDEGQIRLSDLPVRPRDWALGGRAGWRTRDRRSIPERLSTSATSTTLAETSQPTELSGSGAINQVRSKANYLGARASPFAVNSGCSAAMSPVATPTGGMIAPGRATRSARWLAASGVVGSGRLQPTSSRRGLFLSVTRQSVTCCDCRNGGRD